jgi:hypothetical protein
MPYSRRRRTPNGTLLRGFRRGEICALADVDADAARDAVTVNAAPVQVGGSGLASRPQGREGDRIMTGCVLLASVPAAPSEPIGSGRVRFTRSSGGRGIRTHGDVAATMVFKTIAIGH